MIRRTTSTGHILTLLAADAQPPPDDEHRKDEMMATLSGVMADVEEGKVVGLVILGVPAAGIGMEFYSTGMALGDLLVLREEFDDVIEEVRCPDTK